MALTLYNTLSGKKETFQAIDPDHIRLYVCGMTVYDYCHIGHARILVVFDAFVRHLKTQFKKVTYVRNITDIDDKIITTAAQNQEDFQTLTARYIKAMQQDEKALNVLAPDISPKATDYIDQMLYLIDQLLEKNLAYQADNGDVYFAVDNFSQYGQLSKRTLDDLRVGARVEVNTDKKNPLDFVLWKGAKKNEPSWQSKWGDGRPGWHIECSAMSNHLLGNHFDIHGGGSDLIFPHHENEIAQSVGAHQSPFVNYWLHVGFIKTNHEKMSKSLGNFFTIRDVLKRHDGEVIRFFLLTTHYRSPINYSDDNLNNAKAGLLRLYTAVRGLSITKAEMDEAVNDYSFEQRFTAALDDDFNTPVAIAVLFDLAKTINIMRTKDLDCASALATHLKQLANKLGILEQDADVFLTKDSQLSDAQINENIKARQQARQKKDFGRADKIRQFLSEHGITLEDTDNKTTWRRS